MAYIRDQLRIGSLLNLLIGIWLVFAPLAGDFAHLRMAAWNSAGVGVVLILVVIVEAARPRRMIGLNWINLALGLWLIVSPLLFGLWQSPVAVLIHVVMGLFVAIIATGSILAQRYTTE